MGELASSPSTLPADDTLTSQRCSKALHSESCLEEEGEGIGSSVDTEDLNGMEETVPMVSLTEVQSDPCEMPPKSRNFEEEEIECPVCCCLLCEPVIMATLRACLLTYPTPS